MKTESLTILTAANAADKAPRPWSATQLQVNPFLHVGPDRVYNPLTDRTIAEGEPGYAELRSLLAGTGSLSSERAHLADAGWLVPADSEPERQFLLKYV